MADLDFDDGPIPKKSPKPRGSRTPVWLIAGVCGVGLVLLLGAVVVGLLATGGLPGRIGSSGEASTLAKNPWWQGRPAAGKIDAILDELTSRGVGVVYVDRAANYVVLEEIPDAGAPRHPSDIYFVPLVYHEKKFEKLKGDYKAIVVRAGNGSRLTRKEAADLAQDWLRRPSRDEYGAANQQLTDDVLNMGNEPKRKK